MELENLKYIQGLIERIEERFVGMKYDFIHLKGVVEREIKKYEKKEDLLPDKKSVPNPEELSRLCNMSARHG